MLTIILVVILVILVIAYFDFVIGLMAVLLAGIVLLGLLGVLIYFLINYTLNSIYVIGFLVVIFIGNLIVDLDSNKDKNEQ